MQDYNKEYIGYKIKLFPSIEIENIFKQYFGVSRFVYNLGIKFQEEHYKEYLKNNDSYSKLSFIDMEYKLLFLKNNDKNYEWLKKFDTASLNNIFRDVCKGYKNFLKDPVHYNKPKFKKKKYHHQMFYIRPDRLIIYDDCIKIPSIGIVYTKHHGYDECIGSGNKYVLKSKTRAYCHYHNTRIIFDGYSYWLTFEMIKSDLHDANSCKRFKDNEIWQHKKHSKPIGIDINCHHDSWITLSNGKKYIQPNCYKEDKQIKKYQKKLAIKHKVNKEKKTNSTVAYKLEELNYTKNEEKILKKLNKAYKRKTNKKLAVIHECACDIIDNKPEYIVIEDIKATQLLIPRDSQISFYKRTYHNKMIYDTMINTIQNTIIRKAISNDIKIFKADRNFPSSQLCSKCGYRQKIGANRIYKCPHCKNIIDRDINAAINLSNYFNYNLYQENVV